MLFDLADNSATDLVADGVRNLAPAWSHDGRAIYFTSDRNGRWQIWRLDLASGQSTRVTENGGAYAQENPEGTIYISRFDQAGLWRLAPGSEPERLTDRLDIGDWANFALRNGQLLFYDRAARRIVRLDPATGQTDVLVSLEHNLPRWDLALSFGGDGKSFPASLAERQSNDLFLFELNQ